MDTSSGSRRRWTPYLLLTVAPLCWAGNVVVARNIVDTVSPLSLAFWRWTLAFAILLPFAWKQVVRDWSVFLTHWKIFCFFGLTGISMWNTLLYVAVQTTTAINAALMLTVMPAMIVLISLAAFKEKITPLQMTGLCFSMIGAVTVVLHGRLENLVNFVFVEGDLFMLLAVLVYALYSAFLKSRPPVHPVSFLLFVIGIGFLGLLPLYVWECVEATAFSFDKAFLFSIAYFAVFPSLVAYFCWNRGVELIGANRAGLFINLMPVFTSIMALIWLDEALHPYHLIGLFLIFTGMALFNRHR
ncbi:MAG: DMT family transporter [Deltaproteobacteria bacterium]|nr:DMT family transporter [Deltaproteobacteria bacterium]